LHINYRETISLKYVGLIDDSLPVSEKELTTYPLLTGKRCSPSGPAVSGKTSVRRVFSWLLRNVGYPSVEVLVPAPQEPTVFSVGWAS